MFIAAAGGAVVVGIIAYDDHSKYSEYSKHNQYGDAALVQQIDNVYGRLEQKDSEIKNFRERIEREFAYQISKLRNEANYGALQEDYSFDYNYNYDSILDGVKREMKSEVEAELNAEKAELDNINQMIRRINELELQAGGAK